MWIVMAKAILLKFSTWLGFWSFDDASLLFFFDCCLQILCTFKLKPISQQHLEAVLPVLSFHGFITNCPTSPFFTEASAKFLQ